MVEALRPDSFDIVNNEKCRRSLSRYFDIFQDKKLAKFQVAKKIEADFKTRNSVEDLWIMHEELTKKYYELEKQVDGKEVDVQKLPNPKKSYLDLKIEIANRMLRNCNFCERKCGVNRSAGNTGYCKCDSLFYLSTAFQHMGEEAELVPSGTIFSIGCNLTCIHCQNWSISQHYETGDPLEAKRLAMVIEQLRRSGCRNCNMVGGSPTPFLHVWLEAFKYVNVNVPTVWNSNSYYSEETAKLLAGFTDVYLLDFKYGNNECATRISNAPRYVEVCQRNHLYAVKYGEIIIRILLLPGHIECCAKPIIKWIAENLGTWVRVNIMDQYRPEWRAYEIPELRRRLTDKEYRTALEYARSVGLSNFA
jgi:putative pyruvate formate lyase activating enzyme